MKLQKRPINLDTPTASPKALKKKEYPALYFLTIRIWENEDPALKSTFCMHFCILQQNPLKAHYSWRILFQLGHEILMHEKTVSGSHWETSRRLMMNAAQTTLRLTQLVSLAKDFSNSCSRSRRFYLQSAIAFGDLTKNWQNLAANMLEILREIRLFYKRRLESVTR